MIDRNLQCVLGTLVSVGRRQTKQKDCSINMGGFSRGRTLILS